MLWDIAFILVGTVIGIAIVPAIAFLFGQMFDLNGLGRILFTIAQLSSEHGTYLDMTSGGPSYRLRILADPDEKGKPTHYYMGQGPDGEPQYDVIPEGATLYRLGKRPFGVSLPTDLDELHRYVRTDNLAQTDGGIAGEWTPFVDANGGYRVSVRRLGDLSAELDFEGLRDVYRRVMPEAGDQSGMSEMMLTLLALGSFAIMFTITLVMF